MISLIGLLEYFVSTVRMYLEKLGINIDGIGNHLSIAAARRQVRYSDAKKRLGSGAENGIYCSSTIHDEMNEKCFVVK